MKLGPIGMKAALIAAGVVAGGVLAGTLTAQAASSPSTPSTPSTEAHPGDTHPGDNGADGVPEAQEHHGVGLDLSGTVTAVGSNSVTIKTTTATTTYSVTSTSDIDKNGEAVLADLKPGDAVRFSVSASDSTQIDKLHAGDEAKDMPQAPSSGSGMNSGSA